MPLRPLHERGKLGERGVRVGGHEGNGDKLVRHLIERVHCAEGTNTIGRVSCRGPCTLPRAAVVNAG